MSATDSVDLVCFGELIWDMLPSGKVAGGAPFNIVNRANALGLKAELIGSVGNDELGQEFLHTISHLGNSTKYIQTHPSLRTSVSIVSFSPEGEAQYNIVHPVAWDDIQVSPDIVELVKNARAFAYSSLALRDPRSRKSLFALLPHAQLKICDVNLREGHYEKDVILKMIESADILRTNEYELDQIGKWSGLESTDRKEMMEVLSHHYDFDMVIATLGGDGAICYANGEWIEQPVLTVEVEDTVGAGDAFLASFIFRLLSGDTVTDCLKFGCAIGALTASKKGGTPDISEDEIKAILA